MKNKKKKIKGENKFGVFNGSVINSDTLAYDQEFVVEEYSDDSLTISEIDKASLASKRELKNDVKVKSKRKFNTLIFKIIAYVIVLLIIVGIIVFISI
ncbi:hypothetical protein [Spiroplasma culicicola]|uniref:Transmembrane protein n=1 Tax=Spiroplasma culicicola AES-1 TaxID=1276246 RepID=W6AHR0_9MOLU|nr:hypothetical protein [Spiroplasma culicicola]AHI53219.1 hypothetical protein SCULI_v1c08790 [Spiroplasma culicicola AES-1]